MTQEEKELLLKDLCARLTYGVKVQKLNEAESVFDVYAINIESTQVSFFKYKGKSLEICDEGFLISHNNFLRFKPYLRPMSSMTEEEKKEYRKLCDNYYGLYFDSIDSIDWLNKNHFDYRGLIDEGLALEAPEEMYKTRLNMTKEEAIAELKDLLDYWKYIKMYNNKREQEAVEFAIEYIEDKPYDE